MGFYHGLIGVQQTKRDMNVLPLVWCDPDKTSKLLNFLAYLPTYGLNTYNIPGIVVQMNYCSNGMPYESTPPPVDEYDHISREQQLVRQTSSHRCVPLSDAVKPMYVVCSVGKVDIFRLYFLKKLSSVFFLILNMKVFLCLDRHPPTTHSPQRVSQRTAVAYSTYGSNYAY